jgi:hypothetical protein
MDRGNNGSDLNQRIGGLPRGDDDDTGHVSQANSIRLHDYKGAVTLRVNVDPDIWSAKRLTNATYQGDK